MKKTLRVTRIVLLALCLLTVLAPLTSSAQATDSRNAKATSLNFGGVDYLHRWSKNGQNEFTPKSDPDLATWRDMLTVNVIETVRDGQQLAAAANAVLTNYQRNGNIIRTDSKPRTADRPAEHFVAAVLGKPEFLEAAFARFIMVDGTGTVVVYSHRVYGQKAGPAMAEWLKENGTAVEKRLMTWDQVPKPAALRTLPQAK